MGTTTSGAPRIFVACANEDAVFCASFVRSVRNAGYDVWFNDPSSTLNASRGEIERELTTRDHFVVILSTAALSSEWLNSQIDAALYLLRKQQLRSLTTVLAGPCETPLLLMHFSRIATPEGGPVTADSAASQYARLLHTITNPSATDVPVAPIHVMPRMSAFGFTARRFKDIDVILPPMYDVAGGPSQMGTNFDDYDWFKSGRFDNAGPGDDEKPRHAVLLGAYQIGRFPVTVAEYACYVCTNNKASKDQVSVPREPKWEDQFQNPDHPIVGVTWYEARAYAKWLTGATGTDWRLPTEAEWEKAARWDPTARHARMYPWGDEFDVRRCCTTGSMTTIPIGTYPSGQSPYGVQDLVGGIWEWTNTLHKSYPYDQSDGRDAPSDLDEHSAYPERRVHRGGPWGDHPRLARAAWRESHHPNESRFHGFRLARSVSVDS